MNIAFDIDGVLTDFESYQLEKGKSFFSKQYGKKIINKKGLTIKEIFDCTEEQFRAFWKKYLFLYSIFTPARKGAGKLTKHLKQEGHNVFIITKRVFAGESTAIGRFMRFLVKRWLWHYGIQYDAIEFCSESKKSAVMKYNIELMIEDDPNNAEELSDCTQIALMDAVYNNDCSGERINRIKSLEEVDKFCKARKSKKNCKEKHYVFYHTLWFLLKFIMSCTLRPKIINKENIPNEGPVIFCGNHLHVWDQFPVCASHNRMIHWLAKKEYFDSKLGLFFESSGCICVDRYGESMKSMYEAFENLKNGYVIGLFPEGTRNNIKDEQLVMLKNLLAGDISEVDVEKLVNKQNMKSSQLNLYVNLLEDNKISKEEFTTGIYNIEDALHKLVESKVITKEEFDEALLLQFKSGAALMARRTGATIVPFAVTGDYKIGNKNLIVNYGQPFKVTKDNYSEANDILRSKILELVKCNMKRKSKYKE